MKLRVLIGCVLGIIGLSSGGLAQETTQRETIEVVSDEEGMRLLVDGEPMMVIGMNWAYMPIGENYSYDFWGHTDEFIEEALHTEMSLLRSMGVNAIRQYDSIPPRWIEWIYDNYGIYTAVNNMMGRYGMTIDGVWYPNVDYSNPVHREAILAELDASIERYAGTRGVLLWMLGNESNYGLSWTSFEIAALPLDDADPRAVHLYTLMNEAAERIHDGDPGIPVSLTNGDVQYIEIIAEVCDAIDIFGTNVYRGESARDMYEEVYELTGLPVMFTEFGADAYNARLDREDDISQAHYLLRQWEDLYLNAHGNGATGNAIGGFIFQWSDGWWKTGQTVDLNVHNTDASWPNGGYDRDFVPGANNMNEEWFGIAAKDFNDETGHYRVRPRTAYYVLQEAFTIDPYSASRSEIEAHFGSIHPLDFAHQYAALRAEGELEVLRRARVSAIRLLLDTSMSAGDRQIERPEEQIVDHTESFWVDFETEPAAGVYGMVSLNVVGNVAQNRLDDIFYEQRAVDDEDPDDVSVTDRVAIYGAEIEIDRPYATLRGYYRRGHEGWGYEGDMFGIYRETFYGPNLDIYQANAPLGFELDAHRELEGLKLAFGPEVYWGANPMVIGKYSRTFGSTTVSLVHQEDLTSTQTVDSSNATPERRNRRTSIHAEIPLGPHVLELGGLMAGTPRVGEEFTYVEETNGRGYLDSGYEYLQDEIHLADTLAARVKLAMSFGRVNWYVQGGYHGLVADGGYNPAITWQRWSLREVDQGNHYAASTGATIAAGNLTIAPNLLYQVPLVGPNPNVDAFLSLDTDIYYPSIRPRNVIDDPFAVLYNRETIGGEMLLVFDPTPGTWYWLWDRIDREDAPFAWSLDFVYRHQPTSRDSLLAVLESGAVVAFGAAPPASDEWNLTLDWFARPGSTRLYGTLFAGQNQPRGGDSRLITRGGGSIQFDWNSARLTNRLSIGDWGPFDYQRDFNLTYPLQYYGTVSYGIRRPREGVYETRFGLRGQYRTLDENSDTWTDTDVPGRAREYEVGVFVMIGM